MALKKNWKLNNGLEVPNAYIRIISCAATKTDATVLVGVFINKEYADKGESVEQSYWLFKPSFNDESKNLWKQAYIFLKTLPQFEEAENV